MSYAKSMTHYHESVESVTEAIHSLFEDRGGVEFAQEALKNMRESYQSIKKPFFTSNYQILFYLGYCFGRGDDYNSLRETQLLLEWWENQED